MTAFIEGSVQTPTGRIVPMTINAKPIPDPGKLADGNVIVEGNLASPAVEPEPRAQPDVTPPATPAPAGPSHPLSEGWDAL